MNNVKATGINQEINQESFESEAIDWDVVERLDHNDCLLLYEIYNEGSYALPLLVKKVREKLSIKYGAIRHRLEVLCEADLIEKIEETRPKIYQAKRDREDMIRKVLKTKFAKLGLDGF